MPTRDSGAEAIFRSDPHDYRTRLFLVLLRWHLGLGICFSGHFRRSFVMVAANALNTWFSRRYLHGLLRSALLGSVISAADTLFCRRYARRIWTPTAYLRFCYRRQRPAGIKDARRAHFRTG